MSRKSASKRTLPKPKAVLRLPDLDQAKSAVLNSLTSADAQRGYRRAIEEFVEWYCSEPRLSFSRTVVLRYRIHLESRNLAPGTINLRLGAVRRLAYEAADCGLLNPDLAAGVRRVKGVKKIGVRLGNWLTAEQSQRLWQVPGGERLKEKRDRALLAVLLACGLRRHEAVELNFGHIQQREEHWAIVATANCSRRRMQRSRCQRQRGKKLSESQQRRSSIRAPRSCCDPMPGEWVNGDFLQHEESASMPQSGRLSALLPEAEGVR